MVQLPIPIGSDISLPQPINPAANVLYPGGLMGMWVVNPDGSLSPTAANTNPTFTASTIRIQPPNGNIAATYTLSVGNNGIISLNNPGQTVFSFSQSLNQLTLGGSPVFSISNQNLGSATNRWGTLFANAIDITGNLTVGGTFSPSSIALPVGGGINSGIFTLTNIPSGTATTFLTPAIGQSFGLLVVASIPAVSRNWVSYIFVSNGTNWNGGLIGGVTSQLTITLDATFLILQATQTTGAPATVVIRVLQIS